ncbi:MAG: potassium transporter TrkG, partial [Dietzia sp.]|nr:potassium transporter TrkG [Dietzia sp.]
MVLSPVRVVAMSFAAAIVVGTVLLLLPGAVEPGSSTGFTEALFTSTSAMCLAGLIVVDTPVHWSGFGQVVILALIQAGGLGIMTMASMVGLVLADQIGLKARMNTAAEARASELGDVRDVVIGVIRLSIGIELVTAAALALRFALGYDEPVLRALWLGVFHSISSFNNAG